MSDIAINTRGFYYIGSLDISGANQVLNEIVSLLATPFYLKRVFVQVTTASTVATSAITVQWRPTPGSATGAVTIASFTFPVAAVDTKWAYDAYLSAGTTTVIDAGGTADAGGIGGIQYYAGAVENPVGPGGEIRVASDGGATAGVCEFWLEVFEYASPNDDFAATGVLVAA